MAIPRRGSERGVAGGIRAAPELGRRSHAARARLQDAGRAPAFGRHRARRHRALGHVDGGVSRPQKPRHRLHARGGSPGLGIPRGAWGPSAARPSGPWSSSRATRDSGITSAKSRPPCAGASTPSSSSTTTAPRTRRPKIFDDAYGGEQRGKAHELWHFNQTNFTEIAKSMGAQSIRVEKPNELGSALDQAFSIEGRPRHPRRRHGHRSLGAGGLRTAGLGIDKADWGLSGKNHQASYSLSLFLFGPSPMTAEIRSASALRKTSSLSGSQGM